jgi:hypothetical protein
MNTNSRKQDARSQTEGLGFNNPQGGPGHDFDLWVDLPGGICEAQCRETKKGPRFYYWSGNPYGRWIPCKASEVIFRNSEDVNHG